MILHISWICVQVWTICRCICKGEC
jgi:hypothetical protein